VRVPQRTPGGNQALLPVARGFETPREHALGGREALCGLPAVQQAGQCGVGAIGGFGSKVMIENAHLVLEIDRVVAVVAKVVPEGARFDAGNDRAQVTAHDQFGLGPQRVGGEILLDRVVRRVGGPAHLRQPDRPAPAIRELDLVRHGLELGDKGLIVKLAAVRVNGENVKRRLQLQHPINVFCVNAGCGKAKHLSLRVQLLDGGITAL